MIILLPQLTELFFLSSGDRLRVVSRTLSVGSRSGSAECEVRTFRSHISAPDVDRPQRKDMEYDPAQARCVWGTHQHGTFPTKNQTLKNKFNSLICHW